MASSVAFRCSDCEHVAPKWAGRCVGCGEWNTLVECERTASGARSPSSPVAIPIVEVVADDHRNLPTGVAELDRVLGGGVVADSVTLVGGAPGIGKSTLLMQAAAGMARGGRRVLYVSAEESPAQVRNRAARLGAVVEGLWLAAVTTIDEVIAQVGQVRPDAVVVDSIQTVSAPDVSGVPGSPGQVRECAQRLVRLAKDDQVAVVLVGHVTKDGNLAGPRVLEHLVDTVLSFEGDRHHALRMLRAVKHRFGSTAALGLFELTGAGLDGVTDPSRLFLADRQEGSVGSVVTPIVDGGRPLLVEIQSLVVRSTLPSPRRVAQGLETSRLNMVLAVLGQRLAFPLGDHDVYAAAAGGVRVAEPGADLALALALASSMTGQAVPDRFAAVGEIGLGGEVRQVADLARRLDEAARMGFSQALVPESTGEGGADLRLVRVRTVADALDAVGLTASV